MQKPSRHSAYTQRVYATEISVFDNNEVMIDGARQILEYTSDNVKISLGKSVVNIVGDGLCIRTLSCRQLVVCGCVMQVEFCRI